VLKLTPDDICLSVPKIFFAYGFGNSITFPFLSAGAATLLLPGQPKPAAIFAAIEKYRPTVFFGFADALYLADQGRRRGRPSTFHRWLPWAVSAAEGFVDRGLQRLEVAHRASKSSKAWVRPRCCTSISANRPDRKKLGAAGLRVPGYEIATEGQ